MGDEMFLIAAVARNGVIGAGGKMPWHISADFRRVKALTMGKALIMGRKTFESLPGLLPGRKHIVISRNRARWAEGAVIAHSIDEALALAGDASVAIFGGAEIYALALPRARRIELTEVHADVDGDAFMPPLGEGWREAAREEHSAGETHPAFAFVTLLRDPEVPA